MTVLNRGDVVEMIGPQRAVERVAGEVGYALHRSDATNLSTVGFGILAGALIGLPFIMVGGVKLTLSVSVGTLVAGLFFGWLRSVRPTFGNIPQPALQFMINFGLAAFVAGAGLQAGPEFVRAVKDLGASLLLAGVVVSLVPQVAAFLVGRYLLKMNPLLLLGGLAGARSFTAALAAVQEKAGSLTPVLGYTVPYATSNILITVCGSTHRGVGGVGKRFYRQTALKSVIAHRLASFKERGSDNRCPHRSVRSDGCRWRGSRCKWQTALEMRVYPPQLFVMLTAHSWHRCCRGSQTTSTNRRRFPDNLASPCA